LISPEQAAQNRQQWEQYLTRQEDDGGILDRGQRIEQHV